MELDVPYAWNQMKDLFPCKGKRVFSAHIDLRLCACPYGRRIYLSSRDDEPCGL